MAGRHRRYNNDMEKGDFDDENSAEKQGISVTDITMNQLTIESEICSDTSDMEQDNDLDDQTSSSCSTSSDSDSAETENEECPDEEAKKFLKEVHQRKLIAYKRAGSPYTNNERELRKHVRILRSNTSEEIIIFPHAGKPRNIRVLPRIRESPNLSVNPHEELMQEWIDTFLKLS